MAPASRIIDTEALPWVPVADGVLARALWAEEGRRALLIRFAPGAALDRHVHDGDEVLYVLEGSVGDDHGTVPAGSAGYRPPGCTHTVRSEGGATAVAFVTGGVSPVAVGVTGGPPSQVIDVSALPEHEVAPGVFGRQVWAAPDGGRRAMLVRFTAGTALARHRHDGDEFVYVLDGTVADESGPVTAGNAGFRPDGCVHTVSSPTGALAFAVLRGGVAPVQE